MIMKRYSIALMSFVLLALVACNSNKYTPGTKNSSLSRKVLVNFKQDPSLSTTFDQANASGKFIFIDFYTDYCPPCKLMDREVFSNPELASYLNKHFINVKINAGKQKGANLASIYNVKAYPTLIFTDSHGNMIMKKEGGTSVTALRSMAEQVRQQIAGR